MVATNHDEFSEPGALAALAERAGRRLPGRRSVERVRRRAGVRVRERGGRPRSGARAAADRDTDRVAVSRVLVTGGAGTIGTAVVRRLLDDGEFEVRVSDQREPPAWMARACEVHTADLRDLASRATRARRLRARRPPGRDRGRHRQLPQASRTRCSRRTTPSTTRSSARRSSRSVERLVYVSSSMVVRARAGVPDDRGVARPHAHAALVVRVLEARRRVLLPRGARRVRPALLDRAALQRLRAGRDARRRARHRAHRAGPDRARAAAGAAVPDLRLGRADAHAHAHRRHRARHRGRARRTTRRSARTSTSRRTRS